MIYKLRRKFIKICILSFLAVFVLLFVSIYTVTSLQTSSSLDKLADIISENDGRFPKPEKNDDGFNRPPEGHGLNRETPFTTRFFTVKFDKDGELTFCDIKSVASVSREQAVSYGKTAVESAKTRGWIDDFRYKVYDSDNGKAVVLVNGSGEKMSNRNFMISTFLVFAVSSTVIIALIMLISKKAVKPAAESYEKQKQFITDANHELKTPLTLIKTNLDILQAETGENEWLSDIKTEAEAMSELVNSLVALARMDEEGLKLEKQEFSLSDAVLETAFAFSQHIKKERKQLLTDVPANINYFGNEAAIRQLVSILLDNAVKYCDENGTVAVTLYGGKRPALCVDNTYGAVSAIELDKLFDRFYRADKARTQGSGFGVGLSLARAIAQKHKSEISAHDLGNGMIRFRVNLH